MPVGALPRLLAAAKPTCGTALSRCAHLARLRSACQQSGARSGVRKQHRRFIWSKLFGTQSPDEDSNALVSGERIRDLYDLEEEPVASGAFGKVYRGRRKGTGELVAVKEMLKDANPHGLREIEMAARVDHPRVAKLIAAYEDDEAFQVVSEFYDGGDLFDYVIEFVDKEQQLGESRAFALGAQMLEALEAIHRCNLAHLDIKPENFVFRDATHEDLVLVDFGSAEPFERRPYAEGTHDYLPGYDDKLQTVERLIGTAAYMSPEVARETRFSSRSDVWGVGVIIYVMMSGHVPYSTTKIGTPQECPRFEEISGAVQDLDNITGMGRQILQGMMSVSARKRPSPTEALAMIRGHLAGGIHSDGFSPN